MKEGEERILGGGEAEVGEYPWMVSKASSQSHYISLKKKFVYFNFNHADGDLENGTSAGRASPSFSGSAVH